MLIEWAFEEDQIVNITLSKVDEHKALGTFSTLLYGEDNHHAPRQGAEIVFPGKADWGEQAMTDSTPIIHPTFLPIIQKQTATAPGPR